MDESGAGALTVSFRLVGVARRGGARGAETLALQLPAGTPVGAALARLGIRHEAEVSLLVDGRVVGWGYLPRDGETVVVVPPLVGG